MAPMSEWTEQEWLTALSFWHDAELPSLYRYNDEYELAASYQYMHPDIVKELGERLHPVVLGWPQLVVGALEERLDVEGFRLPDSDDSDKEMWRVWQANDLDEWSGQGHLDALVMRRCYAAVGANEEDESTPLVTFESPLEMYAYIDPRTRRVLAALKRWRANQYSLVRPLESYATLYLPNVTVHYEGVDATGLVETDRDEHDFGEVCVVPLVNRPRLSTGSLRAASQQFLGRSELHPILPLVHAANKIATDMMVASEFVAIPLRGFLGAGPDVFEDEKGQKLTGLQAILGRMLMIPTRDVQQFEFAAAQLGNFTNVLNTLAELVAAITGLPPHYMGRTTDNPASADAIRSSEARLVKRAERRQRMFGGSHERVMRLVRRFQEGGAQGDPKLRSLETIWRDAATPTRAQAADAAVKLYNLPTPIVPLQQTREDLGYTQGQITRMKAEDEAQRALDFGPNFKLPTAADTTAPEMAGAGA